MKGLAIVLSACMFLLNMENLPAFTQMPVEAGSMECCSDCCSDCFDSHGEKHKEKGSCGTEEECPPACDCSHQYHITAITYNFIEFTGVVVQSYHYGYYVNRYTFEYIYNFLEPPRFG